MSRIHFANGTCLRHWRHTEKVTLRTSHEIVVHWSESTFPVSGANLSSSHRQSRLSPWRLVWPNISSETALIHLLIHCQSLVYFSYQKLSSVLKMIVSHHHDLSAWILVTKTTPWWVLSWWWNLTSHHWLFLLLFGQEFFECLLLYVFHWYLHLVHDHCCFVGWCIFSFLEN